MSLVQWFHFRVISSSFSLLFRASMYSLLYTANSALYCVCLFGGRGGGGGIFTYEVVILFLSC